MLLPVILAPLLAAPSTALLAARALTRLEHSAPTSPRLYLLWGLAGAAAGGVAAAQTERTTTAWVLPAALVAFVSAAAAACCDAQIQRIPTPLLRIGGLVATSLLALAAIATHRPSLLLVPLGCAAFAAAVAGFCWKFFTLGRGDVRVATVAGLGLCRPSPVGLGVGLVVFLAISLTQLARLRRRHDGSTPAYFPMGPALVVLILAAGL